MASVFSGVHRNGPGYHEGCFKGTILKLNYRKMTILSDNTTMLFCLFDLNIYVSVNNFQFIYVGMG